MYYPWFLLATLPAMGIFWFFLRSNSRWKCDKVINYLVVVRLLVGFPVLRANEFYLETAAAGKRDLDVSPPLMALPPVA